MKKLPIALALLVFASLGAFAPYATAGALDKSRVPADARWVAHVDVDLLTHSALYSAFEKEAHVKADVDLDEFRMATGLDPLHDVASLTVYCAGKTAAETVVLLSGTDKLDGALAHLQKLEGYHSEQAGARTLHTWGNGGDAWYGFLEHREASAERLVVLAKHKEDLLRAIAVVEGTSASLSNAHSASIQASPAPGTILFAAAGDRFSELGQFGGASAVSKLARGLVLEIGEDRGQLFGNLAIETRTAEDAQKIQQVLQGTVALVGLMGDDVDRDTRSRLQRMVGALRIDSAGTRATASFRYDIKTLIEDLRALDASDHDADGDEGK